MNQVTPETWSLLTSPSSVWPQTDACMGPDLRCTVYVDCSRATTPHYLLACLLPGMCLFILIYGLTVLSVAQVTCCQIVWWFVKTLEKFWSDCGLFFSLFHRAFQFTMWFGPTNALVCNKTLIRMSHIKTLKTTPTCFNHQLIIIRELLILVKIIG
jgi:hypothetical protein